MDVKFYKSEKLFATASIEGQRLDKVGVIQIGNDSFGFARINHGDVEFHDISLLVLDDEEVQFAGE